MADGQGGAVVAIGECMLELSQDGPSWRLGHGGDTFNTALHLARLGEAVAFMTALADDPFSQSMRRVWQDEGISTEMVLTVPGGLPGLYAIQTDAASERSFYYWREQAAVRQLFRLSAAKAMLERAAKADLLFLSGITLALFGQSDRALLLDAAKAVRAHGGDVAFDPNYRTRLWSTHAEARAAIDMFAPVVSIALPTFADDAALFGDRDPLQTHMRWQAWGARDVVVKLGEQGCMLAGGQVVAPVQPVAVIDTTGAGDAFNAGYLAARRRGLDVLDAATFANALAGRVIGHHGAIPPRAVMKDLAKFPRLGAAMAH